MADSTEWYVRTVDGNVYGPADVRLLIQWAEDGRIEPTSCLSQDRVSWLPAQLKEELAMDWLVEIEPGNVFGPFNRAVVKRLFANKSVPAEALVYKRYRLPVDQDPAPQVVEKIVEKEVRVEVPVERVVEKIVEKEVRVEVPVERVVEKIIEKEVRVEVPVERVVEKIVEKEVRVEVPVERVIEVLPPETGPSATGSAVVRRQTHVPACSGERSPFGRLDRSRLTALETALKRELTTAREKGIQLPFGREKGFRFPFGLFGRKRK